MTTMFEFLQHQPFFVIFGVVAAGMALGRLEVRGISLGSVVCIILAGLIVSVAALRTTGAALALPDVLKTIFFNLFIFSAGVKIGPQFFAGLERDGWRLVAVGATVALLAPIIAWACGWTFDLPRGAVAGLLAGSNNSSAAFGTATAATVVIPVEAGDVPIETRTAMLSAAFALCYAVSEIQFVLLMKWLPALTGVDAPAAARAFEGAVGANDAAPLPGTAEAAEVDDVSIAVRAYRISTQSVAGHTLADIRTRAPRVSIERVRRGDRWLPVESTTVLEAGDEVVVGAPIEVHVRVRDTIGPEIPDVQARHGLPIRTVDVVVSRDEAIGRSAADLVAAIGPGLYPNAVFRTGEALPAGREVRLKRGDVVRVTGVEPHLADLERHVGPVVRADHSSDVLTLAVGLLAGAALGAIPVPMFGVRISFGAAAVLVTGILFGWVKTRHPALGGPISEGARRLMEELGLNVFTAVLAVNSGAAVYGVIASGPLWSLIASCLIVSSVPALAAWWIGRRTLGLNPALLMGAIAGARQNTASLHAAQKLTRSAVPGIGYPVPLAIATVALSIGSYFLALFD